MASLLSYALTSVSDVKELLDIPSSDTTKDNLIIRKINQATLMIENYTNRRFALTTYTDELYDGSGTDQIVLRQHPVTALTSLKVRDTELNNNDFDAIETDRYYINENAGIISGLSSFYGGYEKWSVTYTAGYLTIPADIAEAAAMLAAHLASSGSLSSGQSVKRMTEGSRSVEYQDNTSSSGSLIIELGLDDILAPYVNTAV